MGLFVGIESECGQGPWHGSVYMTKKAFARGAVSKRGASQPIPGIPVSAPPLWKQSCRRGFRTRTAIADLIRRIQFSYPYLQVTQQASCLNLIASWTLGLGL